MSNLITGSNNRNGLMLVRTNADIEASTIEAHEAAQQENTEVAVISGLAAHIRAQWADAYQAKQIHHRDMIKSLRQRKGEYEPDMLQAIRSAGGTDVYLKLTDVKCRAAESWIREILLGNDNIWLIEPTAIPDISPQQKYAMYAQAEALVMSGEYSADEAHALLQEAKESIKKQIEDMAATAADRMREKIEDQLQEGNFDSALNEFVSDIITFKAGFLKGPIVKRKPRLTWGDGFQPVVTDEITIEVGRISPFDVFPAPTASNVDDGDICIVNRLTPADLHNMIGVKGNNEDAIRKVLRDHGTKGLRGWLEYFNDERELLEGKMQHGSKASYIECLEYRGAVQGSLLVEWGVDKARVGDLEKSYQVEAWMIGSEVIRCVMNADPLNRKPLSKASAVTLPGNFWGMGIPELMADVQRICNAAVRALVDNMAAASGPQVAIDPQALPDGEQVTNVYPWKIWQIIQGPNGNGKLPIDFFQPSMHSTQLLQIYERFARYADEVTGIPAYSYGSDAASGAGRTASGLSMLMGAASKGIKQIISSIDIAVQALIHRVYIHNMLFDEDQAIKGDVKIVARGALALMQKENQQLRRMEMMQITSNPIDMQIIGTEGRAKMLREAFKPLDYSENIIPDNEELKAMQNATDQQAAIMQQQAMAAQGGAA